MLARGTTTVLEAWAERSAVAAFSIYTLESTTAICRAAEESGRSVILQIGSGSYRSTSLPSLAAGAIAAASVADVLVGVHLDHSRSLAEIETCLGLGFTSVMVDGSHLPYEENVALSAAAVDLAHRAGAWAEVEIGALDGSEHVSGASAATARTDPEEAARFVRATGADVLAAAVGTVHGFSTEEIHVDLDRVDAIVRATGVPFALHGASGVADDELVGAIARGAAKVNVNAELRRAYLAGLRHALDREGDDLVALQRDAVDAMVAVALDRIALFGARVGAHGEGL